ncbi:MAG: endonuclease/exonuclease/phosphatase family protein [Candidatus Roizmanbacteria bacterium]|nr:MAG: endonuclease/exonuclease/phosphatase family protein [Candidatus Roizmanbacteria bacterium]
MKFKFITLNLWEGGLLLDNALEFLKKENANIVNLQETFNEKDETLEKRYRSGAIIKKELHYLCDFFSPTFLDIRIPEKLNQGNLVLSRHPIIKTDTIFYDVPYGNLTVNNNDYSFNPRNLQHVNIRTGDTELNVFNTQGIWGFDGNDNERRIEMSRIIVKEIKGKQNVILAGDFNVHPDTITIGNIEKYLKNVFCNELKTTFNMKRKAKSGGFANSVVDMVFISKNIKVFDHYCPDVDVSDHLPLICSFEV